MPRPLGPIPAPLQDRAFTVREALKAGVPPSRLYAADLERPSWGLRAIRPASTLDEHVRHLVVLLPADAVFSHLTAARLWRLPLPREWEPTEPVDVMTPGTPVRRSGVLGHRGLERRPTEDLRGLRVTSPVPTWLDLATRPGFSIEDLVVAGDAFATRDPDLLPTMVESAARRGGRGRRKVRAAAALLRSGSGSAMETRARLMFATAGLVEPELNETVYGEDGQFIARVDFLWRQARVIVEYEGDQHRTDRRQWQSDIERTRLLEALGWRVIRITAADLSDSRRRRELLSLLRELVG